MGVPGIVIDTALSSLVQMLRRPEMYQESSRAACNCLILLEYIETRFWTSPTQHECQPSPPAGNQSTPRAFVSDVSLMPALGFNFAIAHQQQDSLQHSVPINPMTNPMTMIDNNVDFRNLTAQRIPSFGVTSLSICRGRTSVSIWRGCMHYRSKSAL
jgi:hypothetical protein